MGKIKSLFDSRFLKVFDFEREGGKSYVVATRRDEENLVANKKGDHFASMLPDAVSVCLVVKIPNQEPRLLLTHEFRFPVGQYLLSPPAGLIDKADAETEDPLIATARREVFEETGIEPKDTDYYEVINPLLFSSPGMTDESNAIVLAVIDLPDPSVINSDNTEGGELIEDYELISREEALNYLEDGLDDDGIFYSVYTWVVLSYFVNHKF